MLISVLRVRSSLLDVDKLLASHPLVHADAIWHTGEPCDSRRTHADSGFTLSLADEDRTWTVLVQRTLAELDRLSPLLLEVQRAVARMSACHPPEVEVTRDRLTT